MKNFLSSHEPEAVGCGLRNPLEEDIRHAEQICEGILGEQVWMTDPVFEGGFAPDGRTCPTATRLEGLPAAETFLRDENPDLGSRIHLAAEEGVDFSLRAVVADGDCAGGMPRAVRSLPDDGSPEARTFNRRKRSMRTTTPGDRHEPVVTPVRQCLVVVFPLSSRSIVEGNDVLCKYQPY